MLEVVRSGDGGDDEEEEEEEEVNQTTRLLSKDKSVATIVPSPEVLVGEVFYYCYESELSDG
jgi:hypothetical protein